ncbi:clostripain-related cysteine peptidase [Candidatus Dependentiae bacterium]
MTKRLFLAFILFFNFNIFTQADWTIFAYIEASEKLQHEGVFNITQMALGGVPENIHVIVQLHTKGNKSWIYKVEKNTIIVLDYVEIGPNAKDNIISTVEKIYQEFPAKHFCLTLWDHGFGILVPEYDEDKNEWNVEPDGDECGACEIKRKKTVRHKAMFVDAFHDTVMDNDDMVELARVISQEILHKKIEVLAMDCCMGAMLEHGYQLKDYAVYMVGSQDCELADGYDYQNLVKHFHNGYVSPLQLACNIVHDYGEYNRINAVVGTYTMSAMDLSYMDDITSNLNNLSRNLLKLLDEDKKLFKEIIYNARRGCPKFCMASYYADLYLFYENLYQELEACENLPMVQTIKNSIIAGKELIKKAVVANIAGVVNKGVAGISIYFPFFHIDRSYPETIFAKESLWLGFLQGIL